MPDTPMHSTVATESLPFPSSTLVRLARDTSTEAGDLPAGSIGTVTRADPFGQSCDVEFDSPVEVRLTIRHADLAEVTAPDQRHAFERAVIARGEADIAAGLGLDSGDVESWLLSLDTDANTPMPRPRGQRR